jgi:hypothetical protein
VPLLVEDVQVVLHLCKPCSLSVDVLPTSFGALHGGLPSQDGFLFLPKPLNLKHSCLTLTSSSSSAVAASSSTSSSQSSIWM